MSRYSRDSDDGIEDRRFQKKRRLLHDVSTADDSFFRLKRANGNWHEILNNPIGGVFSNEMKIFSAGDSEVSRSSNCLRQNSYSESHIATPGSSFFCNSDGDSEVSSFRTFRKNQKRDVVLQDDFKTALSRDVTVAQDPSFNVALESNKSCLIVDNSGIFTSDNSLDNIHDCKSRRPKYRRQNLKQHPAKEEEEFGNILNNVTTNEYQSRIFPLSVADNQNDVTNMDLNEVSHFKPNETRYGAPSAITYSKEIVTETGQVGGMSYVTISEVKERVIIPGRSCPRPMKKDWREGTSTDWLTESNYNENIDNGYGKSSEQTTNFLSGIAVHEEGALSDVEVESDVLNRSGPPLQYYSPLKHSWEDKRRENKHTIYKDNSAFSNDVNIVSPLRITEMDDSDTYNSSLRSHKVMRYQKNALPCRNRNESYGSTYNDVSGKSNSRRSILREISQNEFELRLEQDDIQYDDEEILRNRYVAENIEEQYLCEMDEMKKVHDHSTKEGIRKDLPSEVRKFACKSQESFIESNAKSDEDMHEIDSVPLIMERRQRRRNRSKNRVENEFNTANRDCSMSDSINSVSCTSEGTSFIRKKRISATDKRTSKTPEKSRSSRDIADSEENVQISIKFSSNRNRNTSIEVCESDGKVRDEENSLTSMEKPKRRSNIRKRKGSKEFNLTIENASLSSTGDSLSMQNGASFMPKKNLITLNSTNDDEIQLIEDIIPDMTQKEKHSDKTKGNYSKSMLIIDQTGKEDDSLHLNQLRPRRRKNRVKPAESDEFNVHLEDASSYMEESISSADNATHHSKMAHKSSVSADEIPDAVVGTQKISIESAFIVEKERSNKNKSSFDNIKSMSNDFNAEANSPVMGTARPKRRSKPLPSIKSDEFNVLLEEVSNITEMSVSLDDEQTAGGTLTFDQQANEEAKRNNSENNEVAEISDNDKSINGKTPEGAVESRDISGEKTEVVEPAVNQGMNDGENGNISKSRVVTDEELSLDADSLQLNVKSQRGKCQRKSLEGEFSNVLEIVSLPNVSNSNALVADNTHNSNLAQQASASTKEISEATGETGNSFQQKAENDAVAIDHELQANEERNISKSRIIPDEEMSIDSTMKDIGMRKRKRNKVKPMQGDEFNIAVEDASLSNAADLVPLMSETSCNNELPKLRHEVKPVNTDEFNIVVEDVSLSNAADSAPSIAETSHNNELPKGNSSVDAVESKDVSSQNTEDDIPPVQEGNEMKGNISKSTVEIDRELSLDTNSIVMETRRLTKRRNKVKPVQGDEFNIAVEDVLLSNAADSAPSMSETSCNNELPKGNTSVGAVESKALSSKNTEDIISPVVHEGNEMKRNISKSTIVIDKELSLDTNSIIMETRRLTKRRHEVKPVNTDEFNIVVEDVSLSNAADSAPSMSETSRNNELPKGNTSVGAVESKDVASQNTEDVIPPVQEGNEMKGNISKNTVEIDRELSFDTNSTVMETRRSRKRRHQVKPVNTDEFNIVVEDVSLYDAADSAPSIAETLHNDEIPKGNTSVDTVESKAVSSKNTEDIIPPVVQEGNEIKRNFSKSTVVIDKELSLDTNSIVMETRRLTKRRHKVKPVNADEFNIAVEDVSLSDASIAETSRNNELPKGKESVGAVESKDSSVKKTEDVVPVMNQEANKAKRSISKSRVIFDGELIPDPNSTVMETRRVRRGRNQVKPVNADEFNIVVEDASLSDVADSFQSEASCQSKLAQKSTELSHSQLGAIPEIKKTNNIGIPTFVDGKVSQETPVLTEIGNENNPDYSQRECSIDNSLSMSKISNVLGNVAESTRGFINNKELISEYFGDVSRITSVDVIIDKESSINSLVSAHDKSKKSLDPIVNKVETYELPHEALRCKSGGENFAHEGLLNFSLEKQTLDSPGGLESNRQTRSPRSICELVRCDDDFAPASLIGESDKAAVDFPGKDELEIIEPPTEPISYTSLTADTAEKSHQTLGHNQSSSKSTNILTDGGDLKVSPTQNSQLEIKSYVEQKMETDTELSNIGTSKEETEIKSCQPNPTLAPKIVSRLPVPIKCNKRPFTSKSTYLLNNPSTSPPKLVLHSSPEEEKLPKKSGYLKSINEETFTLLPSENSPEKANNLFNENHKDACESSHPKSADPEVQNDVQIVSRALDSENLSIAEKNNVSSPMNAESEKLNHSLPFLETQVKTSTTINELTFIKTAAPGMTSTPLPSMPSENMRYRDVSMLSEISELTLDQIAAVQGQPFSKGNLSVIESTTAVNNLTFIKLNCHSPCFEKEASQHLCDKNQSKEILDDKKSVVVTNEPKESSDGKDGEIMNNSRQPNNLKSSINNSESCSLEPAVEQTEEKQVDHSAKELTFTISAAPAALSPSKASMQYNDERRNSSCASEPVNDLVNSGNCVLAASESFKNMVSEVPSDHVEVNSGGKEMDVIALEVHLNVSKADVQNNATVTNSSISSANKMLQDSANQLCNPSENDAVNNDSQKPHSIACNASPDPTLTISKPISPKLNETPKKITEQSKAFDELLLMSPLNKSVWNAICLKSDSIVSKETGNSEKMTTTGNESEGSSDQRCAGKSPFNECEVGHSINSGIARELIVNSSELPNLKEVELSHLRISGARSFELRDPRPYTSASEKEYRNTEIGGQEIDVSGPFSSRRAEGSHLRLSSAVTSKFIQSRPSSSVMSERSSLRPSLSNHTGWSSVTSSSAKESDADFTRPGISSHTSVESSEPETIESLPTPCRTRYEYFTTPTTADRNAVRKILHRIDASVANHKKQQDLIFDSMFPKVVPAHREFKKPRIPPKPKKVQLEDIDEDEEEIDPPVKKRRLPVWARNELKTVLTEAIEEQGDCLHDPQEFLFDIVDTIKLVMKSKRLKEVKQGVLKVKQELFNLKLVRTYRDFYQFVRDHFPHEFRIRSIPSSGNYKFNPVWETDVDLNCSLFHE